MDLQSRLLSAELARQGVTKKARDAMLGNLSCFQEKTKINTNVEEMGEARVNCASAFVQGAENLTNWYKPLIFRAANTEELLRRVQEEDKAKERSVTKMDNFWGSLNALTNTEEREDEKMITDMVNIYAEIAKTNEFLRKKAIPDMYKNCMKARPDIQCPRP